MPVGAVIELLDGEGDLLEFATFGVTQRHEQLHGARLHRTVEIIGLRILQGIDVRLVAVQVGEDFSPPVQQEFLYPVTFALADCYPLGHVSLVSVGRLVCVALAPGLIFEGAIFCSVSGVRCARDRRPSP